MQLLCSSTIFENIEFIYDIKNWLGNQVQGILTNFNIANFVTMIFQYYPNIELMQFLASFISLLQFSGQKTK